MGSRELHERQEEMEKMIVCVQLNIDGEFHPHETEAARVQEEDSDLVLYDAADNVITRYSRRDIRSWWKKD